MSETKQVICLHGLWMPGSEMAYIKMQLESGHDFDCSLFNYPSVKASLDENAELLADFLADSAPGKVHMVGHSLGGVLALRMMSLHPDAPVERVVCLGSPLLGSRAAGILAQHEWGNSILGKTIAEGVLAETAASWASKVSGWCEIGIIAGNTPLGLGRMVTTFDGEHDGTVSVAETKLPGARDHLTMPVSHSGMVVSKDVAEQTAAFLKRGEFLRE